MTTWVKLNVGGTKFETTLGTLTSSPDSLLGRMFDPDSKRPPAAVSEDGCYLIDACPRAFAVILYWLRYKEILGKEVDPEAVIPVADYFGLPELCERLQTFKTQNINNKDIIRLNVGGTIFETTRRTMTAQPGRTRQIFSSSSPFPMTADGAYFIDASPKAVEIVLNWIRSYPHYKYTLKFKDVPPPDVSESDLKFAAQCFGLHCNFYNNGSYRLNFLNQTL